MCSHIDTCTGVRMLGRSYFYLNGLTIFWFLFSDSDLVIISSDNDLVELDTPQATPTNQEHARKVSKRKSKGKDSIKKKKKKKNTNKSKGINSY